MKKILTVISFTLSLNAYSQNGIYIITEKYNGMVANVPSFDSLFVTNPSGISTSYSLPHYIINPSAHDSQLSVILNNISSQGFRIIPHTERMGVSNTTINPSYFELRTFYMGMPWTSAGLEPAGANNSQFKTIEVFPNPCDEFVNIKLSEKMTKACLVIISAEGYIILKSELNNNDIKSLDVSKLTPGTYFIRLVNDKFYSEAVKFIVR